METLHCMEYRQKKTTHIFRIEIYLSPDIKWRRYQSKNNWKSTLKNMRSNNIFQLSLDDRKSERSRIRSNRVVMQNFLFQQFFFLASCCFIASTFVSFPISFFVVVVFASSGFNASSNHPRQRPIKRFKSA